MDDCGISMFWMRMTLKNVNNIKYARDKMMKEFQHFTNAFDV